MEITDIQIRLVTKATETGKLKAVASIVIDEAFAIHDIKIIDGKDGVFIAMPSRKTPDGTFRDIAHPINTETRTMVCDKILEAFKKESGEQ
ncbi:MAG: septation regulator SpoVG [Clostridia bacterium]|nr:septation regulator SpoVG [Clostridia bacterium]